MIFIVLVALAVAALTVAAALLILHKDKSEIDKIVSEAIARQEYMQSIEEMKKELIPELMRSEWITSGKTLQQVDEPMNGTWKEWTMTRFMKVD